jgi:hypothetical protein
VGDAVDEGAEADLADGENNFDQLLLVGGVRQRAGVDGRNRHHGQAEGRESQIWVVGQFEF